MSVGNATQAVSFDRQDLTLVLGQNLDLGGDDTGARNGTGKTTIINALSYALYGSALTNIKGQQAQNPTLTIVINRSDLEKIMGGQTTFEKLLSEGRVKFEGDRKAFDQLKSTLTVFTPDFELIPGTKAKKLAPKPNKDPFEAQELAITAGE